MDYPLDTDHVRAAAEFTAAQLRFQRPARVHLTPGDATAYRLLIAGPGLEFRREYVAAGGGHWVALLNSFGHGNMWDGQRVDPGYCATSWVSGDESWETRLHVGEVLAAFLNELRDVRLRVTA
jgi:hypothetical protein